MGRVSGLSLAIAVVLIMFPLQSVFSSPAKIRASSSLSVPLPSPARGTGAIDNESGCPSDIRELTPLLLEDLPSYSNRVIQRTQDYNQAAGIENYIITAGEAEFEPLRLPRLQYNSQDDRDPKQIFFTVLERQYINNKIVDIQTYHWLFLTQTDSGWRTVMMFSRFGSSAENKPPAPPRETTNGIIGRGVQLWLRDCRAGTITAR